ncbi:MAG: DNA-directed RNA polymerase subunit omega [Cyanobacteria bacterium RI_101]|nr:DNA-directed RNA polymerase subunit omega [Cyanobacteria bacterium RI_101]MEB3175886.1 DNA-directed RNA polymerase subunit omega [Cyanobacteriota bacterium]
MHKRIVLDSSHVMYRSEELLQAASNRYSITVRVAERAKRIREEPDNDLSDDPLMKPVIRAVIEMSDEITQPGIIRD